MLFSVTATAPASARLRLFMRDSPSGPLSSGDGQDRPLLFARCQSEDVVREIDKVIARRRESDTRYLNPTIPGTLAEAANSQCRRRQLEYFLLPPLRRKVVRRTGRGVLQSI